MALFPLQGGERDEGSLGPPARSEAERVEQGRVGVETGELQRGTHGDQKPTYRAQGA